LIRNAGWFLRLISTNAGSFLTLTKIVHDADFFELKIPVFVSTPQHFSWPLFYLSRTASIWIGLFRKERQLSNSCYKTGILAYEWLSQRSLPPSLIPAQHRGIPTSHTTVPARSLCNGWLPSRQRPWSGVHGNPLFAIHTSPRQYCHCTAMRKRLQSLKAICTKIWGTPASIFEEN
jgi:hypothetical protein